MLSIKAKRKVKKTKVKNTIKKYFEPKSSTENIYREDLIKKIEEISEEENFVEAAPEKTAEKSDGEHSLLAEANFQEKSTICNSCEKNVRLGISYLSHTPNLVPVVPDLLCPYNY